MGGHFPAPRATRHRPAGRYTSLVGGPDDEPARWPVSPVSPVSPGTRVHIRGENGAGAWYSPSPAAPAGAPPDEPGSRGADTVVIGDLGLLPGPRRTAGTWPQIGVSREPPPRPWYHNRNRLTVAAAGLAVVAFAGFLGVPALLGALGAGPGAQGGFCPQCQFPIPSSAAVPPGTVSSPAAPATAPPAHQHARATGAASAPPPAAAAPQPRTTPAAQATSPFTATYSATPGSGGQFTGQLTVANHSSTAITNWQLVIALPYDTVSAVQNAEISDQNDVLFLSPAPDDLSIAPGGTVDVTIFGSGPATTPAECSFNNVACG